MVEQVGCCLWLRACPPTQGAPLQDRRPPELVPGVNLKPQRPPGLSDCGQRPIPACKPQGISPWAPHSSKDAAFLGGCRASFCD